MTEISIVLFLLQFYVS